MNIGFSDVSDLITNGVKRQEGLEIPVNISSDDSDTGIRFSIADGV